MLRFGTDQPKPRREVMESMIDVVFLLLIFFLMTAQLAPPDPMEVTLPLGAAGEAIELDDTLFVGADGTLAYEEARDEAVFAVLAARTSPVALRLRIDAGLPAPDLARLLRKLAEVGQQRVTLLTVPR